MTGAVTTRGIVVGDYEGPSPAQRGFFLQAATGDGDPATSDGIFVFNGNSNSVNLGDLVTVSGTAADFQDQTQISATQVTGCGTGSVATDRRDAAGAVRARTSSASRACSCGCRRRCT